MIKCPTEVLGQILGHLHQPYHYHHYALALLGEVVHPCEPAPWNPIRLQSVCRKWRALARPLFYRQVALDVQDPPALDKLAAILEGDAALDRHPAKRSGTLVFWGTPHYSSAWDKTAQSIESIIQSAESRSTEVIHSLDLFISDTGGEAKRRTWICTNQTDDWMTQWVSMFCKRTCLEREIKLRTVGAMLGLHALPLAGEQSVAIRLSASTLFPTLQHFVRSIAKDPFIPHLELDFPFPLAPARLDEIGPVLKSILLHPSLHTSRIPYLLEGDNPRNTIAFRTHTYDDAQALWTRIEGFGELAVDVEVNVLDL